nr:hypothetical protein [Tanacetum cinerariifolium]
MYRASNLDSIKILTKELEEVKLKKDGLDGKLEGLLKASKNLYHLIESQRSDQVKEGVGYNAVPPAAADLFRSPKKDLSWTSLPEFVDDTVTDYSRPSPTVESTLAEGQNKNSTTAENGESTNSILSKPAVNILSKPAVKFVKAAERPTTDKVETVKKPAVRYAEMYRRTSKRSSGHRPYGGSMRPSLRPDIHRIDRFPTDDLKFSSAARCAPRSKMNSVRPNKPAHSYGRRPFQETTQDLMIILIQRVQRLKKELKSRTPIHKVDRGRSRPVMAWVPK